MNKVSLKKLKKMQLGGNVWQQLDTQNLYGAFGQYLPARSPIQIPYSPLYTGTAPQGNLNGNPFNTNFSTQMQQKFNAQQETQTQANVNQYRQQQQQDITNTINKIQNVGSILATTGDPTLVKLGALTNPASQIYGLTQNWSNLDNKQKFNSVAGISGQVFGTLNQVLPQTIGNPFNSKAVQGLTQTVSQIHPVAGGIVQAGLFALNGLDNLLGKKTHSFTINQDTINSIGSDYDDTTGDIYTAKEKSNKKYSIFNSGGRRRANRFIDETNRKQNIMTTIATNAERIKTQSTDANALRYTLDLNGGINSQYLRVAKLGAKLTKIKEKIDWQPIITIDDPIKLEKGGNVTIQVTVIKEPKEKVKQEEEETKNVIPDGALHAHKHHMDNADSLTQKGIPVVDDKGEQQAEIERDEIILHLKLTNKLEELQEQYEKASKTEQDKLAIEAGKLLVEEILHNTIDNTNLIDKCKEGGKINGSI